MAEKNLFLRIAEKEVPADIVYEDDRCVAFRDNNPQAPVHVLIIPRKEMPSLETASETDSPLLGHLLITAAKIARELKLNGGYRTVINCGRDAGQSVDHLHVHLLGGRALSWPPG
jgi:histidine triad (HIT) family protein